MAALFLFARRGLIALFGRMRIWFAIVAAAATDVCYKNGITKTG